MENIFTAIRPFYVLAKTLGLFPMSFEGPALKGHFDQMEYFDAVLSDIAAIRFSNHFKYSV